MTSATAAAPPQPPLTGKLLPYVCPVCARESHNPTDAEQGYCGACRNFTGPPAATLVQGACAIASLVYDVLDLAETELAREDYLVSAWPEWLPEARAVLNAHYRFHAGPDAAYFDPRFTPRPCDRCERPYRGPAVYCSLGCALADAA